MKHLTESQVQKLIETAEGDRNKLLFTLLFQHGLRISEALKLTQGSLQRGGYLRVRASKKGKHTDERMDPATVALWNRVAQHLCPNVMLFPFSRQWSDTLFHRYCTAAKIELPPRCGVHSLRHSLGHLMLDAGASLPEIQKALRHKSLQSTSVYLEADASDVDRARARAIRGDGYPSPRHGRGAADVAGRHPGRDAAARRARADDAGRAGHIETSASALRHRWFQPNSGWTVKDQN
jgi:integrase